MPDFQSYIPVNGSDYFLLLLDQHMRKHGPLGNVGRFVLELDGPLTEVQLRQKLKDSHIANWLNSVGKPRRNLLFKLPQWKSASKRKAFSILTHSASDSKQLPESIFSQDIRLGKNRPFHFDLIPHSGGKTTMIFSWHHSLMDAHGIEMFLKMLGGNDGTIEVNRLFPKAEAATNWPEEMNKAREVKKFLFDSTRSPLAMLMEQAPQPKSKGQYRIIAFSEEETTQVDARARELKVRFGNSPMYLAATARGIHQIRQARKMPEGIYWIPVPQDQRKRGAIGPIISNQVSFLFYKLTDTELGDISETIQSLSQQMMDQIRNGITASFAVMMGIFRRLPMAAYRYLMHQPTRGDIASFFFSDTGNSLKQFTEFMGLSIKDATHFPPNAHHPGFTLIFMRVQNRLKVVVGYTDVSLSEEEIEGFVTHLRGDLLGDFPR